MPTMTRSKPAKKSKGPVSRSIPAARAGKSVKRVYFFGNGKAEGNANMKDLLGGKGANLADMTLVPLPVPPGGAWGGEGGGGWRPREREGAVKRVRSRRRS